MNTKNLRSKAIAAAATLAMLGAMPLSALAAVPAMSSISPSFATAGSAAITITVNGSAFEPSSVVNFNGNAKATAYVSANQLTASIPAADLATVGTYSVTVTNPGAGGGTSGAMSFTVGNIVPMTTSLSSTSAAAGTGAFTLTVNGFNFIPASTVYVNGSARATTYVSSGQLTAGITSADLANAGTLSITVINPGPGGGTSNAQIFTVIGSTIMPVVTSISPSERMVGLGNFTLTVNGANFNAGSQVRFNGLPRTTTFISSTQLTAFIPASDTALSGGYIVNVINPSSGGGVTSNSILFTVSPTTTVPTLPNTGFGPGQASVGTAAAIGLLAALLTALAVRRALIAKR